MKKQIPTVIGILIILLVAGAVGASVFFLSQEEEEKVLFEKEVIDVDEKDEDEGVKIYRNEELGIEFEYPEYLGEFKKIDKEEKEVLPGREFPKKLNRGITYEAIRLPDNNKFPLYFSLESKDFYYDSDRHPYYVLGLRTMDKLPAAFGEIDDINSYCKEIKNRQLEEKKEESKDHHNALLLNCEKIEVGNRKGVLKDHIFYKKGLTGAIGNHEFFRLLLVNTHIEDYPVFIVSLDLDGYLLSRHGEEGDKRKLCIHEEDCFSSEEIIRQGQNFYPFKASLEQHEKEVSALNQIISTFRFLD